MFSCWAHNTRASNDLRLSRLKRRWSRVKIDLSKLVVEFVKSITEKKWVE